jgi:hypothetical protein
MATKKPEVKQPEPKQELVKRPEVTTIQESIPAYLRAPDGQRDNRGFEEVTQADIKIPMLRICQSMSPYRMKSDPKYIRDLEEGQFFNTITKQNYGNKVRVVPLMMFHSRLLFSKEGKGLLCRALDAKNGVGDPGGLCAKCPNARWLSEPRSDGSTRPLCDEYKNYAIVVVGTDGIVHPEGIAIFPMKGSAIPVSDEWIALARLRGGPMFGGIYEFTTTQKPPKKQNQGPYYVPVVNNAGFIPQATKQSAEFAFNAFSELRRSEKFGSALEEGLSEEAREPGEEG